MLKEDEKSFNKTSDYFLEKMNKGKNNYINSRKKKLEKRAKLINYLETFTKINNEKDYFNKRKKRNNRGILLKPDIKNLSTDKKFNFFPNTENNSKINYDNVNDNSKTFKNKSVRFVLDLSPNFNSKKKYSYQINLKTHFNSFNFKDKINFNNNSNETNKNTRSDSFFESQNLKTNKPGHFNSIFFRDRLSESRLELPPTQRNLKNKNNITNYSSHKSKNKKKKVKVLNPFKYSNSYRENFILEQILKHPNLKLLYETNEKRAINMIKSHSKSIKKKLSLKNYQQNLLKNTLLPLDKGEKQKLQKTFIKINNSIENKKKMDLYAYLTEIQEKEKALIDNHNEIEETYDKNIEKIGLTLTGKRKIHIEKMTFADIFKNQKFDK